MEYRVLPHGGEKISVIGMGSSVIGERPEEEIIATVRRAMENGINYFDMAGGHATIFEAYGKALEGKRDQVYLQIHFGADYTSGEYGWTTSLEKIKESIHWQMEKLRTDYMDFGFIHCLDEGSDLDTYIQNGVLDYIQELKRAGMVHHIGMSSHTPSVVHKVLDMGILDVLMFSINPLYDYGQGEYAIGSSSERYELYRRCEKEDVGIVVMKPFCGGQLLDAEQSAFGVALGKYQCIQYALDKPGVLTVVPGYRNEAELMDVLGYFQASDEQKDYSVIAGYTPKESEGVCVYCKHCHPCPAGLDIALINKYYDLAMLGDNLAREHYRTLDKTAKDCIGCGHCDSRCPFHVHQSERMKIIRKEFGK
ncbi:MAG: aldo/keto reductase [Clostridiales bacterium]|nr:aldo/keto reductase [Clostridiales bacterium]